MTTCKCGKEFFVKGHPLQKNCSTSCGLRHRDKSVYEKIAARRIGIPLSLEVRKNMSKAQRKCVLEGKNNLWNGGVSTDKHRLRNSFEMKIWREEIFERDNFTCQICTKRGGTLNADHIKPFGKILEEMLSEKGLENVFDNGINYKPFWEVKNGRTLCFKCHKKTETYGVNTPYYKKASIGRVSQ